MRQLKALDSQQDFDVAIIVADGAVPGSAVIRRLGDVVLKAKPWKITPRAIMMRPTQKWKDILALSGWDLKIVEQFVSESNFYFVSNPNVLDLPPEIEELQDTNGIRLTVLKGDSNSPPLMSERVDPEDEIPESQGSLPKGDYGVFQRPRLGQPLSQPSLPLDMTNQMKTALDGLYVHIQLPETLV